MSALQDFSEAQLFFLAFVLLSAPVFLYLYIRPAIEAKPQKLKGQTSSEGTAGEVSTPGLPRVSSGLPVIDAEAPLPLDNTAKPAGPAEPAELTCVTKERTQRDEVLPPCAAPGTMAHDAVILPLRPKPSEAGFPAKAHYDVPASCSFQIVLEVRGLIEPQELALEMASSVANEESGSLVAEIGEGEEVGLILECLSGSGSDAGDEPPIDIDAAYQAFSLGSRPVTAIFLAHSRAVECITDANMSLRVTACGVATGKIDFEITVYPTIPVSRPV